MIVPVGMVDELLRRQVEAVLSQHTTFPFDLTLSLNSSAVTDEAAIREIVDGASDPRVRVVSSADRRGAAHARNVGARASEGPLLAFCDADDEVRPGWLTALVRGLGEWDAVTGHVNEVAPAGQESWRPAATPGRLPTFLGAPYILSGNLAISRAAFESVGGFDESLTRCEDIALGWSLLNGGFRLGYVADAVLDYRHRAGLGSLMRQHYWYGRGMAEVISRYHVPSVAGTRRLSGLDLLRPNAQPAALTVPGLLRRVCLGTGRVVGLLSERLRLDRRDRSASPEAGGGPGGSERRPGDGGR